MTRWAVKLKPTGVIRCNMGLTMIQVVIAGDSEGGGANREHWEQRT